MYQKEKSSESKVKFRQASKCCKSVLQAVKLAHANKKKSPLPPRNLALGTSGELLIVLNHIVKSAIPFLFNGLELLSSASDKAKLFAEDVSKNSNLDDSGISLPVFLSRTNLKLDNICVTPKMVKKVIMNHDLSKASGPDCIPVVVF